MTVAQAPPRAAFRAVNSTPGAIIAASVVFRVRVPLALNERQSCLCEKQV